MPLICNSYCIAGNTIGRAVKNGGNHLGVDKDVSFTLNTTDRHAVTATEYAMGGDVSRCVTSKWHKARGGQSGPDECANMAVVKSEDIPTGRVRRLTPVECERLQGLPDNYTNVPMIVGGKERPASDSSRYKAIGNGMAQPCADWIIKRIVEADNGYQARVETDTADTGWAPGD